MPISDIRLVKAQIKTSPSSGGRYFDGYGSIGEDPTMFGFRTFGETEAMKKLEGFLEAHGDKVSAKSPLSLTVGYEIEKSTYRGQEKQTVMILKAAVLGARPVVNLNDVDIYRVNRKSTKDGQPVLWLELKAYIEGRKTVIELEGPPMDNFFAEIEAIGLEPADISRERPLKLDMEGDFIYRNFAESDGSNAFRVRSFTAEAFTLVNAPAFRPGAP